MPNYQRLIVAASKISIKLMCKEAHSFMLNTWGGGGEREPFLKMKIITAILKFLDHWMWDPSNMIWEAVQV